MPSSRIPKKPAPKKVSSGMETGFDPSGIIQENLGRAKDVYMNIMKGDPLVRTTKRDLGKAAQFASAAARSVIRDAQGAAKMIVKGFGN